jgi:hypothetical protein
LIKSTDSNKKNQQDLDLLQMTKSSSLMPVTKSLLKTKLLESSLLKTLLLLKAKPLPLRRSTHLQRLLLQLILLRTPREVRIKKLILLSASKEVMIKIEVPHANEPKVHGAEALPEHPADEMGGTGGMSSRRDLW